MVGGGDRYSALPGPRRASSLAGGGKEEPVIGSGMHGRTYGAAWSNVKCGLSSCVTSRIRFSLLLLWGLLQAAPAAQAQGLPEFAPLNPMAGSRSGLYFQPYREPLPGRWTTGLSVDYASVIEYNRLTQADYVLDSELLRVGLSLSRDLGRRSFLLLNARLGGAYAGFMDGFLDWYHRSLGLRVLERERRPRDEFLYTVTLPDGSTASRAGRDLFLDDMRIGLGVRSGSALQTVFSLTIPTSTGPGGYGRGVPSISVLNTVRSRLRSDLVYEGSVGLGLTPAHGSLSENQREAFVALTSGLRFRVWKQQAVYANLFYHSPYYHDTSLPALDRRELSLDFGWILQTGQGGEWRLGLTEDLEPGGPGVDLIFRLGHTF
jgi:hypothetical protein